MDIPKDKLLHAGAGAVCGIIGAVAGYWVGKVFGYSGAGLAFAAGAGLATLAGAAKELYDRKHEGAVELADAVVTALAGAVTAGLVALV